MTAAGDAVLPPTSYAQVAAGLDPRTQEILRHRRGSDVRRRRGWLLRRMLLAADVTALLLAFVAVEVGFAWFGSDAVVARSSALVFLAVLPGWILLAKIDGLYDHDGERADHTTVDEIAAVFRGVTIGTWLFALMVAVSGV